MAAENPSFSPAAGRKGAEFLERNTRKFCPPDPAERLVPLLFGAASGGPCASEDQARFSSAGGEKGQSSSIVGVATSDRRVRKELQPTSDSNVTQHRLTVNAGSPVGQSAN